MKNILRLIFIILIFMLIIAPASTQNPPTYTLEPATVDEFIEAIPKIISRFSAETAVNILEDEFWLRYANTTSLEQFSAIYEQLNDGWRGFAYYSPYLNIVNWHLYALERWLTEHPTNLADIETLEFGGYQVTVTELFVSDLGQPDWLLSLRYPTFAHHWLARRNPDMTTGYELISMPTSYYEANFAWSQPEGGSPRNPIIEDVTGDGLVEFIFTDWMPAPASWTTASYYSYEVISWGEEGLHEILYTDILDDDDTPWVFENIDDDSELELLQTVNYWDNLQCHRLSYTEFDFLDNTYIEGEEVSTFADTVNCDLHQAEQAYNNEDLSSAIIYYQQAREHYASLLDSDERDDATPYFMYASEKLIISYALTGQLEEAEALIIELNEMPQTEETIAYALGQIIDDGTNAVEICQTAYSAMKAFIDEDSRANYRGIPQVGSVNEAFYGENYPYGTRAANESACDMNLLIQMTLSQLDYSTSSNPMRQFQDLGIIIDTNFHADINDDGAGDWLLWFKDVWTGYLFLSQGDQYTVVKTNIPKLNENLLFREVRLPSGKFAIAIFNNYQATDCTEGGITYINSTGMFNVVLWMLNDQNDFTRADLGLLCTDLESPDTISFDETVTLWQIGPYDTDNAVTSSEVFWNPDTLSYGGAVTDASNYSVVFDSVIRSIRSEVFFTNDYITAINQVNESLEDSEGNNRAQLLYYRGLSEQMLGEDEAALADYVTVYTDVPYTIWGYLAELQLSEVATD